MKKTYKIEVDCANCANKMEVAAKNTEGVKDAVVNFMTLKMNVEFEDGADPKAIMPVVLENCKKVEDECEIGCIFRYDKETEKESFKDNHFSSASDSTSFHSGGRSPSLRTVHDPVSDSGIRHTHKGLEGHKEQTAI